MHTHNGSSPPEVTQRFFSISRYLTNFNFFVKYISTDGDISFDFIHRLYFDSRIYPNFNKKFEEIVNLLVNDLEIPISDFLHLLKTARSRLIQHLVLIDPEQYICINTTLFAKAVNLGPVFTDKSSSGSMKDAYAISLFSWYSFVTLIEKGRFEAAFYVFPFTLMLEAVRSSSLSKMNRLNFLEFSFEIFKNHLQVIHKIDSNSLFKQRYSEKSLGVLFSDEIFLKRIMNTIIGLAISIKYFKGNLATQRIGTHDIELFFGHMRLLSYYDNSFENAIRIACDAIILRKYCNDLGMPISLNKRENEGGIVLTEEINNNENIEFDGFFITSMLTNLMRGIPVEDDNLLIIEKYINNYTQTIIKSTTYKKTKIPHLMTGRLPYCRYNMINFSLSILPIPKSESTFQYYASNKKFNKKIEKVSILQWCMRICADLHGIKYSSNEASSKIPFKYDLDKIEDIEKIISYLQSPLNCTEENSKIYDFENHIKSLIVDKKSDIQNENIEEDSLETTKIIEEEQEDDMEEKDSIRFDNSFNISEETQKEIECLSEKVFGDNETYVDEMTEISQAHDELDDEKQSKTTKTCNSLAENVISNLNNPDAIKKIIKSSKNPKKVIKKAAKRSLAISLKNAMRTYLRIFENMTNDEFISKFNSKLSDGLLNPFKEIKNDQVEHDEHEDAINQFIIDGSEEN